ncbi:hypothetical protein [Amycolatopsis sp. lyj-23]|uniref:hypothetical protein n=1 Tax=Amycolatopsis sp. lyj-23 TaxID=2789283 RepID=UPI00397BE385
MTTDSARPRQRYPGVGWSQVPRRLPVAPLRLGDARPGHPAVEALEASWSAA